MATEAKRKSNQRYLDKLDRIVIRRPQGQKEVIQQYANRMGKSINAYINNLIDKDMEPHKEDEGK